jgi:hypothetical protein
VQVDTQELGPASDNRADRFGVDVMLDSTLLLGRNLAPVPTQYDPPVEPQRHLPSERSVSMSRGAALPGWGRLAYRIFEAFCLQEDALLELAPHCRGISRQPVWITPGRINVRRGGVTENRASPCRFRPARIVDKWKHTEREDNGRARNAPLPSEYSIAIGQVRAEVWQCMPSRCDSQPERPAPLGEGEAGHDVVATAILRQRPGAEKSRESCLLLRVVAVVRLVARLAAVTPGSILFRETPLKRRVSIQ